MMVMMMFMLLVIMMVMMFVFIFIFIIVIVMMMTVFPVIMMVMVFVFVFIVFIVIIVIIFERGKIQGLAVLDDVEDEIWLHVIPGSGDDTGVRMGFCDQLAAFFHAVGIQQLGTAEDHGGGALYLVQKEFAEILHIHPAFAGVHHRGAPADFDVRMTGFCFFHSGENLAQLAHAGGLHEDPVGMISIDQLVHRSLEIPGQGAADAAGVQFGYSNAGILHEAAVNPDLAVFILQQNNFFAAETAGQQFFDQRGFSRAEEPGDNIDFYHGTFLLPAGRLPTFLYITHSQDPVNRFRRKLTDYLRLSQKTSGNQSSSSSRNTFRALRFVSST